MSATEPRAAVAATGWVAARLGAPTEALEIRGVEVGVPGPSEVRVATETFCLDFNDIDTIYDRYGLLKFDPPFVVGMAAAGTVDAAGPGAEALLGRRVVGCTVGVQGGYASAALLNTATVQILPSWLSFVDGVAMYFPYLLGWLALRERGHVQAGDVVLVHAAAGGIGSGVVQLAKAFGATVIATAGSDAKVDRCFELRRRLRRQLPHERLRHVCSRRHERARCRRRVRHHRRSGHDGHLPDDGLQRTPSHRRVLCRHRGGGASGQPPAEHLWQLRPLRHLLLLRRLAADDTAVRHELPLHGRRNPDLGQHPPDGPAGPDPRSSSARRSSSRTCPEHSRRSSAARRPAERSSASTGNQPRAERFLAVG